MKIADFGLSRDVYESECYQSQQNMDLPIRWMPPESIEQQLYTLKSDVVSRRLPKKATLKLAGCLFQWSYGIVLWELTTAGMVPYSGKTGFEVLGLLKSGRRLEKPRCCPDEVYDIMQLCWQLVPEDRPDFLALSERLVAVIDALRSAPVKWPAYYNIAPVVQQQQQQQMVTTA